MTEYEGPKNFYKNATTSELNDMLAHGNVRGEAEQEILAEKDRRLANPNSPDFRPSFF